ncbi:MAG TPA: hypothetical protein VFQ53_38125 [Kofleriaceae bacterium]|nr:hypothetical protein [Kofleriaceae bacterium]
MKKTKRKLEVRRKVVVELQPTQLETVVGGGKPDGTVVIGDPRTNSCTSTARCPA